MYLKCFLIALVLVLTCHCSVHGMVIIKPEHRSVSSHQQPANISCTILAERLRSSKNKRNADDIDTTTIFMLKRYVSCIIPDFRVEEIRISTISRTKIRITGTHQTSRNLSSTSKMSGSPPGSSQLISLYHIVQLDDHLDPDSREYVDLENVKWFQFDDVYIDGVRFDIPISYPSEEPFSSKHVQD